MSYMARYTQPAQGFFKACGAPPLLVVLGVLGLNAEAPSAISPAGSTFSSIFEEGRFLGVGAPFAPFDPELGAGLLFGFTLALALTFAFGDALRASS